MKILPNGSMPVSGTNKDALVYHGPGGMGRGIWLTRQGKSFLPPICRPKSVPAITSGKLTNNHIQIIAYFQYDDSDLLYANLESISINYKLRIEN